MIGELKNMEIPESNDNDIESAEEKKWAEDNKNWEHRVKNEIWPTYNQGVEAIKKKFLEINELLDKDQEMAKPAFLELKETAEKALNDFDNLSKNILKDADQATPVYWAISLANHRARKYFESAYNLAEIYILSLSEGIEDMSDLKLSEDNIFTEKDFEEILEQGESKLYKFDNYLKDFENFTVQENGTDFTVKANALDEEKKFRLNQKILLDEVIKEFINNAKEAMSGRGQVEVGGNQEDGQLIFYVKDNGPGIPEDKMAGLFKPKESDRKHGTGFGLSGIKRVVEQYLKGVIEVESVEGQGAKFIVTFPEGKKN